MNTVNAMYRFAEDTIKQEYGADESDETLQFLQQAVVDEDEYLRYRISERFNDVLKSLFEAHKKDSPPIEENPILHDMKEDVKTYLAHRESPEYGKMLVLGRQLGLNLKSLSNEEIDILLKALQRSDKVKKVRKKRK